MKRMVEFGAKIDDGTSIARQMLLVLDVDLIVGQEDAVISHKNFHA